MKILVCVKQVIHPETSLKIDTSLKKITENESTKFHLNRFDEYALEEALLIKETHPNVTIDAVSVGPERVTEVLRQALCKGADNGIHILYDKPGFCPPNHTAQLLADYADGKRYDLILTGVMAEDDMLCQVGPMLAAILSLPCAVSVIKEAIDPEKKQISVDCEMESGMKEKAVLSLPALLTIQSGINQPRYPSLSNILRANAKELTTIEAKYHRKPNSNERLCSLAYPKKSIDTAIFDGTAEEKAEKLLKLFHKKSLLKAG